MDSEIVTGGVYKIAFCFIFRKEQLRWDFCLKVRQWM
eukprot:UN17519